MWGQPRNPFGGDLIPPIDLGVPPLQMPTMAPMAAAVQAKPQSHAFFREGGPGRTIIGIIADALAGATGGQGTYAPLMLQKRREQMLEDREARRAEREANAPIRDKIDNDYVEIDPVSGTARVLYHGTPKAPTDEFSRYLEQAGIPEAERPAYYRKQVEKMTAPPVDWQMVTDQATGAKSLMAVPRAPAEASKPPPAVGEVRNGYRFNGGDPANPANYVQVGGPTPQASGTFR